MAPKNFGLLGAGFPKGVSLPKRINTCMSCGAKPSRLAVEATSSRAGSLLVAHAATAVCRSLSSIACSKIPGFLFVAVVPTAQLCRAPLAALHQFRSHHLQIQKQE